MSGADGSFFAAFGANNISGVSPPSLVSEGNPLCRF